MSSTSDLFAPPAGNWVALAPSYLPMRRLTTLLSWGSGTAVVVASTYILLDHTIAVTLMGGLLAVTIWRVIRQSAIVRAWGYAEYDSGLHITSGVFFRRLTVVPYARMQAVEVSAGPLQRAFKVATVKLVTASAQSDAVIPGLEPKAAAALRDRLTERGETQATGL